MPGLSYDNIPFPDSDMAPGPNKALGRFFTAWGQVEVVYGMIFRDLCGMDRDMGQIVFEKIGVREQLDILDDMTELIADDHLRTALETALQAIRAISVARNKIAHSRWGLIDGEPARFWVGMTNAQSTAIWRNEGRGPTWREKFIFTVPQIQALTESCVTQRDVLHTVLGTLTRIEFEQERQAGVRSRAARGRRHPALREQ